MQNTGIKPLVMEEIRQIAKKHQLQKVILFGSRARGTYERASDIDLAVSGGNVDAFSVEVEEETSTLLTYDVVDLDQPIQKELRQSIEREGKLLYEKI